MQDIIERQNSSSDTSEQNRNATDMAIYNQMLQQFFTNNMNPYGFNMQYKFQWKQPNNSEYQSPNSPYNNHIWIYLIPLDVSRCLQ